MEAELDGMVGRLRVEVQAIIGFARLNQGDVFEISLKHGQQKWKTRGKTQPDRTQRWETNSHQFTCYPDQPLIVKVAEVRMIKSKTLSERQFDPTKFFAPQPLLVTMNLNSIGSLKLKLVVTWLPLMTSKAIAAPPPPQLTDKTLSSTTINRDFAKSPVSDIPDATASPPKICLREKKRQGRGAREPSGMENWRSSTTILDSVYKDLSKSIPTIDDLTAFGSRNNNNNPQQNVQHQKMRSDSAHPPAPPQKRQPQMGVGALRQTQQDPQQQWLRSVSMHHLSKSASDASSQSESVVVKLPVSRSTIYCKGPASSFNGSNGSGKEEQTSVVVELRARKSTDSDDSSGVSSLGANGSVGKRTRLNNCERVDSLLQLIDRLRASLGPLRQDEFPEVSAFEAAMLNWEAALKLNRALFVENSRSASASSTRRAQANANRLAKRASLYSVHHPQQPSPPSTLSSEDSNERHAMSTNGDHIFENDSGIDSLRQQISPYNRHRNFAPPPPPQMNNSSYLNGTASRCSNASVAMGPAQRRFNKHMQERRRRSLGGWILDDPVECERWLSALNGPDHEKSNRAQTASGHPELDLCLQHHLSNSLIDLEELAQIHGPFDYRTNELLNRVEQNTVAMEEMLRISDALPSWPNVTNLLSDLGAEWDVQEMWLSTCYAQNASIIVPSERLRSNLQSAVSPIVKRAQYPQLVMRVTDTLMSLLLQSSDSSSTQAHNQCVSIFEFGSLFAGKQFGAFVENMAHEAFITTSLETQNPSAVREIMDRLRKVPIVPPMEALRHIGLVLQAMDGGEAVTAIERYFRSASNELQNDLAQTFINLLENKDPKSRAGACKALAILKNEQCMEALEWLANEDSNMSVRQEAQRAFDRIHKFFSEYQEITKI